MCTVSLVKKVVVPVTAPPNSRCVRGRALRATSSFLAVFNAVRIHDASRPAYLLPTVLPVQQLLPTLRARTAATASAKLSNLSLQRRPDIRRQCMGLRSLARPRLPQRARVGLQSAASGAISLQLP